MYTMCKTEQPIGIRDSKWRKCTVPFAIMRQSNGRFMAVLNNYPINGSLPNAAKTLLETEVGLEDLADALAISELKDMLDYRLAKIKKDQESRP